jgi:hypothetical protein
MHLHLSTTSYTPPERCSWLHCCRTSTRQQARQQGSAQAPMLCSAATAPKAPHHLQRSCSGGADPRAAGGSDEGSATMPGTVLGSAALYCTVLLVMQLVMQMQGCSSSRPSQQWHPSIPAMSIPAARWLWCLVAKHLGDCGICCRRSHGLSMWSHVVDTAGVNVIALLQQPTRDHAKMKSKDKPHTSARGLWGAFSTSVQPAPRTD